MHQLKLEGSNETMGVQYGQILKMTGLQLPPPRPEYLELAKACQVLLEKHAPELMIELDSLITASGIDYDTLLTLTLTSPLQRDTPSCSVVAILPERTKEHRILVGRNYDFFYDTSKPSATTYFTYPENAFASIGNSDMWVGRADGLNEMGLFIGSSVTFLPVVKPGLAFWFIVRLVLERCATVDEAVALLDELPHGTSFNYLLADKSGKALAIEATPDKLYIREPNNGVVAIANHVETPALVEREMFHAPDSLVRAGSLCDLGKNLVDIDILKNALSNRKTGINAHGEMFGRQFGTIWSIAAYIDGREIEIAEGQDGSQMTYNQVGF